MRQDTPTAGFIGAQGSILRVMMLGLFLEQMGRWGKRRYYIRMYKALKQTIPALHQFSKDPMGPMSVTEGDIDAWEVRQFIRNVRKQTLALRRA